MAAAVTSLLSGGLLTGINGLIDRIKGKSPEDAAKLAELAAKYQSDLLAADLAAVTSQLEVNKAEATSSDKYTSRWRPTIGYICGAAFAIQFVVGPLATWIGRLFGAAVVFPQMDMTTMMPVLLGLLGLGGYRSWEKVNGKA